MSELGKTMFGAGAIGAGAGFIGGGIYGVHKANQKIKELPTDTVTLGAHETPIMEERVVGNRTWVTVDNYDYDGDGNTDSSVPNIHTNQVTADYPLKNADGTVQMEHHPAKTVTDHGKAIVTEKEHSIREPYNISNNTYISEGFSCVDVNVDYRTIGHYTVPEVRFETGVSKFGHFMAYGLGGAAIGGVAGALVGLAMNKANA